MREIVLDLPFPPSANSLFRALGKRVIRSSGYRAWEAKADNFVAYTGALRGVKGIRGAFHAEIILNQTERRRASDLDNRLKPVLDFAQRVELIANDRDCDRITAYWGEAPHGCRLTLREVAA